MIRFRLFSRHYENQNSYQFTPIKYSLEGQLMVFAAEESRKTGTVVDIRKYEAKICSSNK